MVFPPGKRLLDVLVEGFHLHRSEVEAFEPFLVVRLLMILGAVFHQPDFIEHSFLDGSTLREAKDKFGMIGQKYQGISLCLMGKSKPFYHV